MRFKDGIFHLENFNLGGLAPSKWSGTENAFYKIVGWDLHSTPGLLKVAQKLTKDTSTTITALCRARVSSSNGAQYWFSYTDGKIWEHTSGGTWRLVHTTTPAAGTAGCFGAIEYQGYIYWATQSRLHRILVSEADDNDWSTDAVEDWATFTITETAFHPMLIQNQVLFIGDGNYVAQVDAGVFTADALDLKTPLRVKSLGKLFTDLLIGTYVADNVTETEILRWNTWSVSFTNSDPLPEIGVNAFLHFDNFVLAQAGVRGNIYFYDGVKLEPYKKIPGDYSPTAYGEVYPTAVGRLGELVLFGFSNGSGNPADQGVYQFGRYDRDYPYVLDMPYPISERSGSDLVLSGIEIGGVLAVGSDVYVSWQKETTVTITIASPGVVTYTGHSLTNGDAIVFTTTGSLPTGLTAGTIYFARSTGDNTLNIYDTSARAITGGATGRIDTSGTQSGVHTASNFGIDKLDWSNKIEVGYLETTLMSSSREKFNNFSKFLITYAALPANTAITIEYKKNYAANYVGTTEVKDEQRLIVQSEEGVEATVLQLKISVTVSSNDAPEIESGGVFTS